MKYLVCIILILSSRQAMLAQTKTVEEAMNTLKIQLIDPTQAGLEQLTHPDLSYGHSSGKIENRQEFIQALISGTSDFVSAEFSEVQIKITGKTATVRHTLAGELKAADGKINPIKLHNLLVWVKAKGGWKLLVRQAVRLT